MKDGKLNINTDALARYCAILSMTRSEIEKYKEGDEFMELLAKKLEELDADEEWSPFINRDVQINITIKPKEVQNS